MPKENLIFLPDSPYSQWIIDRCERVYPDKNHYINFCADVPKYPYARLSVKGNSLQELHEVANSIKKYKKVILHYHNDILGYLLDFGKVPAEKVSWVLWSGDLYNTPFYDRAVYLPKTKENSEGNIIKAPDGVEWVKQGLKYFLNKPGYFAYKKSFQRIGTIASFFEGDVAHASRVFRKKFTHLPFAILSFEELVKGIPKAKISEPGEKILLGHAGVPENNHFDLFDRLKMLSSQRLLVCPLSYGNPTYIDSVSQLGKSLFAERIEIISSFMPRDEYYLKLSEMGFAVFNTLVQQAFGNILGLLYMGVKVFLNHENTIYQQLKKIGVLVFQMEELNEENLENTLTFAQINYNRDLLKVSFSEEVVNGYYSSLLNPAYEFTKVS